MLYKLRSELKSLGTEERAKVAMRYFKTGKGEYGEGDIFLGLTVPDTRNLAIKYKSLDLKDIQSLLSSKIHEERLVALLILVHNFEHALKRGDEKTQEEIYNFYLKNTKYVNNWDLVDLSSHHIVGNYLLSKPRELLLKLAHSDSIWDKRISIISTFAFIRVSDFKDSLKIAEILLNEKHDLMHKAVGWMLREIGKRDKEAEIKFLNKYYKQMPRTMLRYAIEKFPEKERKAYLNGEI